MPPPAGPQTAARVPGANRAESASSAVTAPQRTALFPDLPTIGEFYPGYEVTIWLGLFAPATPQDPVMARLRADTRAVLGLAEVKDRLNSAGGLDPFPSSPEEFSALIRRDYDKYGKLIREAYFDKGEPCPIVVVVGADQHEFS